MSAAKGTLINWQNFIVLWFRNLASNYRKMCCIYSWYFDFMYFAQSDKYHKNLKFWQFYRKHIVLPTVLRTLHSILFSFTGTGAQKSWFYKDGVHIDSTASVGIQKLIASQCSFCRKVYLKYTVRKAQRMIKVVDLKFLDLIKISKNDFSIFKFWWKQGV